MARLVLSLGAALVGASLTGCLPVCHHYKSDTTLNTVVHLGLRSGDPMRQNVWKAMDDFPVVGTSTREEVLLRFGEPDDWAAEGRLFVYRWRLVTMVMPYFGDWRTTFSLHLSFDERGTLQSSTLQSIDD